MSEESDSLLSVKGLTKTFPLSRTIIGRSAQRVRAVDGVDLEVPGGLTVGVVGESGSGKSTLGRLITLLDRPDSGTITLGGTDITQARGKRLTALRTSLQVIFQDPLGSLDPTKSIGHAVAEPLFVHGRIRRGEMREAAGDLLARVGLDPVLTERYPEQLSGGQRQRVCIARSLALSPRMLVADEPTSALDLSTRSEILNLLLSLQEETGQAILLISHDFATVQHLAHRVAVMYLGRIVEEGPAQEVVGDPLHPYTQALASAVPVPDPVVQRTRRRILLNGEAPDPANPPSGCRFRNRCRHAMASCATTDPPLIALSATRKVACLLHEPSSPEPAREPAALPR
ncbi:ABC transporter ATP-binding protein [Amycolatopsis pigmentata]|uniref:ABC transporter ATP-binding protein n=1 Tax=Amycolatopsis pigmentata TaxID=450801 RepID=A0ABW5FY31_9PSEU